MSGDRAAQRENMLGPIPRQGRYYRPRATQPLKGGVGSNLEDLLRDRVGFGCGPGHLPQPLRRDSLAPLLFK